MAIVNDEDGFTQLVKLNVKEKLLVNGEEIVGISTTPLSEGQVFKYDAATDSLVYAGATVDPDTGIWTFDSSIEVPGASVKISDTLTLSEATGSLISQDEVNGLTSEHVIARLTSMGSSRPNLLELSSQVSFTFQPDNSQQITTNPLTVPILAALRSQTNSLTFETFATMDNVRITVTDSDTDVVMMYLPKKSIVRDGVGGFNFRSGTNTVNFDDDSASDPENGIFNIGHSPFRSVPGQLVNILVEADNVAFLGDALGQPFSIFGLQVGIDRDVAYVRDTSLIADNYIELNIDATAAVAITGGVAVNYLPTATADTLTDGQFVAGVASTSNPFVVTVGAATFSVTDLVQVSGTQQNDGLYEVLSHAANVLTVKGVGLTATVEDFTKDDFVSQVDTGTVTKVNVSVIRSGTDGMWEEGKGSQTPVVFVDLGLQNTIYNADDEVSASRQVTANSGRSVATFGYNTDQSTYTTRGGLFLDGTSASISTLASSGGDGGITGERTVVANATAILVADSLGLKGIEGQADYSANYDSLTYTQKVYVDANSFYNADGSFTANRQVDVWSTSVGGNDAEVDIYCFNTTKGSPSSWTERGRLEISKFGAAIAYDTGDGGGGFTGNNLLNAASDGVIYESTSFFPMRYDIDNATYVTNMSADVKSIPNVRWVNENTFYGKDETLNNTVRIVTFEGTSQLSFVNATPNEATFTGQTCFELNSGSILFRHAQGDGIGGTTGESRLTISGSSMLVTDTINTQGLLGAADFSANYVPNSYVQELYVQPRSSEVIYVQTEADFPTPVSGVITIGGGDTYEILESFILTTNTTFELNGNVFFQGQGIQTTNFGANSTAAMFLVNGDFRIEFRDMTLQQDGSGALVDYNATNEGGEATNCQFVGSATGGGLLLRGGAVWLEFLCTHTRGAGHVLTNGGALNAVILNTVAWEDGTEAHDMLVIEDTHSIARITIETPLFLLVNANSRGIVIGETASADVFELMGGNLLPLDADVFGFVMENPDVVSAGLVSNLVVQGPGTFIGSAPQENGSPLVTALVNITGVTMDVDGNMILADQDSDTFVKYVGLSTTVDVTIAAPALNPYGVAWAAGNLISLDSNTDTIYVHDGFSTTILDSFASPATANGGRGIAWTGSNLLVLDAGSTSLFVLDGLSATILETIDTSTTVSNERGVAYDGNNVILTDDVTDEIVVYDGISNVEKYRFSVPSARSTVAIHAHTNGFLATDNTANDTVYVYDYPVTFDHTSKTWEFKNSAPLTSSAFAGGSQFEDQSGVTLTISTQNEWIDVQDSGVDIFYNDFSKRQKAALNDEQNGEIIWLGAAETGRTLSAEVVITRALGGATNIFYEVVVAISKDAGVTFTEVVDGKGSGVIANNNDFVTINTLPVVREIGENDLIKVRLRNTTNTQDPTVSICKLSIT